MCNILDDNYYDIEKYYIEFRSQSKPEKQQAISKQGGMERPSTGQGRAQLRRKRPEPSINQLINHQTCHRKFLEEQN